MAFRWECHAEEFASMGATYRPAIGYKRKRGESWPEAAARVIPENSGPLLARWLWHSPKLWDKVVLDFGAGAGAIQVRALQLLGIESIVGYEWPPDEDDESRRSEEYWESVEDGYLDPHALDYTYDVILASNVLNVQPSWGCFLLTLGAIKSLMRRGSRFVANLASEPRRIWRPGRAGDQALNEILRWHFYDTEIEQVPKRDGRLSPDWIFVCREPVDLSPARERDMVVDLMEQGLVDWQDL